MRAVRDKHRLPLEGIVPVGLEGQMINSSAWREQDDLESAEL